MKRLISLLGVLGLVAAAVLASAVSVNAAKPSPVPGAHFKSGEDPNCTFTAPTDNCEGTIVGLGGMDVDILLAAPFTATVTCTNPQNQQNPSMRTTTGTASGETTVEDASNNLEFTVSASLPGASGTCRNNWIMTSSTVFTGQWTISVCVDGQLVLSQQSSASAPPPSCS